MLARSEVGESETVHGTRYHDMGRSSIGRIWCSELGSNVDLDFIIAKYFAGRSNVVVCSLAVPG